MASLNPTNLKSKASAGEKRLHAILGNLPDGCFVYYEPCIGGKCPDFVVLIPTHGILVIEVKGWFPKTILRGSPDSVTVEYKQRVETFTHPERQARDYRFDLMNQLKESRFAEIFLHVDGNQEGRLRFPIGHFGVLSNLNDTDLDEGELGTIFPSERFVTQTTLDRWESLESGQLLEELVRFFDPFWPIPKMPEEHVKALRTELHPEVFFEDRVSLKTLSETALPLSERLGLLKELDERQRDFAMSLGTGHRILYGVAGSGKTLILLARARRAAAENPEARILLTCYNRALVGWLSEKLADLPHVTVVNFHRLASENGVRFRPNRSDQELGERLLARLEEGSKHRAFFDVILVDEAQDFEPNWFRCLLATHRDPEDGDFVIVADGSQGLYRRSKVTWAELGIKARGRTISQRYHLQQNYRNPSEIIALAETFATAARIEEGSSEETISSVRVEMSHCLRSTGASPLLFRVGSRVAELRMAAGLIESLLEGVWDGREIAPLQPQEIALLYPWAANGDKELLKRFSKDLSDRGIPVQWFEKSKSLDDSSVKLQTIHSSKGLQYRAVILLWADKLPRQKQGSIEDRVGDRRLFYVGVTRAESFLALTTSDASEFIGDIEAIPAVKAIDLRAQPQISRLPSSATPRELDSLRESG